MRAFNLIPADERGGAERRHGQVRRQRVRRARPARCAGDLRAALRPRRATRSRARAAEVATLNAQTQQAQAQAARLAPYTSFMPHARTARAGGRPARRLTLRLGPRLPRTRPRAAQGRLADLADRHDRLGDCRRRHLEHLDQHLERRSDDERGGGLGHPARQRPDLHAQRLRHEPDRGRADARSPAPDRRRQRSHAAELHRSRGDRSGGGRWRQLAAASGRDPAFAMQVTFDAAAKRVWNWLHEHNFDTAVATDDASTIVHDIHRRCPMTGSRSHRHRRDRGARRARRRLAFGRRPRARTGLQARRPKSAPRRRSSPPPKARSPAPAARRRSYATAYASLVNLGKAVPTGQEVPSLIYQLAQASNREAGRILLDHEQRRRAAPARARARARSPLLPAAGFTQMPFTFVFSGSFFDLYNLFQQLNRFYAAHRLRRPAGQRPPAHDPERQAGSGNAAPARARPSGRLTGTITATAYVLPASQGADRRSDAASPTGVPQTTSGSGTSSSATTPAVIGASR